MCDPTAFWNATVSAELSPLPSPTDTFFPRTLIYDWVMSLFKMRTFDMFNISKQPTIIVEVDIVRQRLVLRREVGSTVFQEPPFHSIFIFLFFPPDEKEANKRVKTYLETLIFFTGFLSDDGCSRAVLGQWKMKGMAFPNHLQRLCSSSSFFLIFSCLASSISPFVLFGFL